MEDTKETGPSRYSRADALMNSQRLWQHARGLGRSKPDRVSMLREGVDIDSIPNVPN